MIQLDSARPTPPPWLNPAITPHATQKLRKPADRADQRIAVGREGERAVDDLLDAGALERREMPEADFEAGRDAVEVVGGSSACVKSHGVSRSDHGTPAFS